MIRASSSSGSTWNDLPWKFEAGTSVVAEAVGLGAAVDYLDALGMEHVRAHEHALVAYALERLAEVEGVRVVGPPDADRRGGVVVVRGRRHPPARHRGAVDREGVCVRAGHHCASR